MSGTPLTDCSPARRSARLKTSGEPHSAHPPRTPLVDTMRWNVRRLHPFTVLAMYNSSPEAKYKWKDRLWGINNGKLFALLRSFSSIFLAHLQVISSAGKLQLSISKGSQQHASINAECVALIPPLRGCPRILLRLIDRLGPPDDSSKQLNSVSQCCESRLHTSVRTVAQRNMTME